MARRNTRSRRHRSQKLRNRSRRNRTQNGGRRRKRGGRGDLLTPLLLLGAQQMYASRNRKKTGKSRRRR